LKQAWSFLSKPIKFLWWEETPNWDHWNQLLG
jgi:hypothetical protein